MRIIFKFWFSVEKCVMAHRCLTAGVTKKKNSEMSVRDLEFGAHEFRSSVELR